MRAIDSSGSVPMHIPQLNTRCFSEAAASSARSAANWRSSSSNWRCNMEANWSEEYE
jgi:hypothetical protein